MRFGVIRIKEVEFSEPYRISDSKFLGKLELIVFTEFLARVPSIRPVFC